MEQEHLCDTCLFEIATCTGQNILFGIDRNPEARGAAADIVLACDTYEKELNQ